MGRLRIMTPVNLAASLACSTGAAVTDGTQTVLGDDIKPRPGSMRSLLLSMEGSVHGRIPDILGGDETERVDTIARFLQGTTERELNELLGLVQLAITQVNASR
jgi:hypothetical protein